MLNYILKQIHFLLKRTLSSGDSVKITFSLFFLLFVYLKDALKVIMSKKGVLGKDLFIGANLWKYQGYERFSETYQSLKHDYLQSYLFLIIKNVYMALLIMYLLLVSFIWYSYVNVMSLKHTMMPILTVVS